MEKHFSKIVIASLLAFLSLTACTRDIPKTSVQLKFPNNMRQNKLSSLSAPVAGDLILSHLIINVTASGMTPVFFAWDGHDKDPSQIPSNFGVDVQAGDGRLVQVLAVYQIYGTGDQQFFYGEKSDLSISSDTNVEVTVDPLGDGTQLGEGQISGRYIDGVKGGVVSGPTSRITMKFKPPGKQPMTIEQSEMINGYFRVFALKTVKFDYILDNGVSMFGGPVNLDNYYVSVPPAGELNLKNPSTMKVYMPAYYRDHGGGTREPSSESTMVFGWWSPDPSLISTKSVCYNNTADPINNAYVSGSVGNTDVVQWMSGAYVQSGGYYASSSVDSEGLCTESSQTRFTDYLSLDHKALGDHDRSLAFQAPYFLKNQNGWRNALNVSYSASSKAMTVKYDYLPGVIIGGTDIFARVGSSDMNGGNEDFRGDGDGLACAKIAAGGFNFRLLKRQPMTSGVTSENVVIPAIPSDIGTAFTEGAADVVICPYSLAGGYFKAGASFHSWNMSGQSATELVVSKVIGNPTTGLRGKNGVCTPFLVSGANGWLQPQGFNFTTDNASVQVYGDQNCSTAIGAGPFSGVSFGYLMYMKSIGSGTTTATLTISDPGAMIADWTGTFTFVDAPTATQQALALVPPTIKRQSCYAANLIMRDSSTPTDPLIMSLSMGSPYYSYFYWPTVAGLTYYSDPQCMGSPSGSPYNMISNGQSFSSNGVFFKYTGGASTISLAPTNSNSIPTAPANVSVTSPGALNRVVFMMPMQFPAYNCVMIDMQLQDSAGNPVAATGTYSATLTESNQSGAHVYPGAGDYCSCGATPLDMSSGAGFAFSAGDTTRRFCYSNDNNGASDTLNLTVTTGGTPASVSSSINLSTDP